MLTLDSQSRNAAFFDKWSYVAATWKYEIVCRQTYADKVKIKFAVASKKGDNA